MTASQLVKSSLRVMARYKLRSGFMMLGSFIGVAAVTFVVSVGAAADEKLLATVRQLFGARSSRGSWWPGSRRCCGEPRSATTRRARGWGSWR